MRWILGCFLSLCIVSHGFASNQPRPRIFRFSEATFPESFDIHAITSNSAANIVLNLYEGLTVLDPQKLTAMPAAAERWEISPDGLVYTFHLRANASWSDRAPLQAADFVFAWRRALTMRTPNPNAYLLLQIKGASELQQGKNGAAQQFGAVAVSAKVLRVTLVQPVAYFLELMMLHTFLPLPSHQATADKLQIAPENPDKLISNGAFTLASIDKPADGPNGAKNSVIHLRPNPYYWGAAKVQLQAVDVHFFANSEEALQRFIDGGLDYTGTVPLPLEKELVKKQKILDQLVVAPWLGTFFLRINCRLPAFRELALRQALNLAIDRQQLLKELDVVGNAAFSLVPRSMPDYVPQAVADFNPQRAKELLHSLAQPSLRRIEILNNQEAEDYLPALQKIAAMWKEHLGIETEIRTLPWTEYLNKMHSGDYQIARSSWIADYPDPSSFLKLMLSNAGNNRTGWGSKALDRFIAEAEREVDAKKRQALLMQADRILADELPVIPVYGMVKRYLLKPQVKGFYDNYFHQLQLKNLSFE